MTTTRIDRPTFGRARTESVRSAASQVCASTHAPPAVGRLAASGCQAIWIPIDFLVYENMGPVTQAAAAHRLPLVSSSLRGTTSGAVAGVLVDYEMLGERADGEWIDPSGRGASALGSQTIAGEMAPYSARPLMSRILVATIMSIATITSAASTWTQATAAKVPGPCTAHQSAGSTTTSRIAITPISTWLRPCAL